jgi:hypothetical protein
MTTKATTKKTSTSNTTKKPRSVKVSTSVELPKNPLVFEVLNLVSKQRSKAKKVEVLKKYEDMSLKILFVWNFDESVVSVLPEGDVPYSSYDEQTVNSGTLSTRITEETRRMYETGSFSMGVTDQQGRTTIRKEAKNFYFFVKGGNDGMNKMRKESMFINLLQGLHPLEAEVVCLVKDKKLSDKYNLTQDVVAEAYPDIQWGNRS